MIVNAIRSLGIQEHYDHSRGDSDANIFNANNKQTLNLSVAYKNIHKINESISVESSNNLYKLCLEIVAGGNYEKNSRYLMIFLGVF